MTIPFYVIIRPVIKSLKMTSIRTCPKQPYWDMSVNQRQGDLYPMHHIVIDQPFMITVTRVPRILIVDDEDSVAFIFERALKRLANYETVAITESTEALHIFRQQHFDLVITDYHMPKMNGVTLVKRIRQLSSQIPILMITAFDDSELHRQAVELSIQTILRKPVDIVQLYQTVSGLLQESELY